VQQLTRNAERHFTGKGHCSFAAAASPKSLDFAHFGVLHILVFWCFGVLQCVFCDFVILCFAMCFAHFTHFGVEMPVHPAVIICARRLMHTWLDVVAGTAQGIAGGQHLLRLSLQLPASLFSSALPPPRSSTAVGRV
jgi:hypothetical protein